MAESNRDITGRTVLITGAGGGIGRALVQAFLDAGAGTVLAAGRTPPAAQDKVVPVRLDVTDPASVAAVAATHGATIDILVNNAGRNFNRGLLDAETLDPAREEMAVNYFGPLQMIRALAPGFKARGRGVIVNMITVLAHVNLPLMGSYCASKAALLSLTQGVRAELAASGIRVIGILPGAVDTIMTKDFPPPKMAPAAAAQAVVDAIRDGGEDVYPGDMAQGLRQGLQADPKAVERQLAQILPPPR